MPPGFITTAEAAAKTGLSATYVRQLCREGAIKAAQQFGRDWMIPASFKWKPQKPGPKPKAKSKGSK